MHGVKIRLAPLFSNGPVVVRGESVMVLEHNLLGRSNSAGVGREVGASCSLP